MKCWTKLIMSLVFALVVLSMSFAAGQEEEGGAKAEPSILRIAYATPPSSIDPQYHNHPVNLAIGEHIFDALIYSDENVDLHPALAVSWDAIEDDLWEFKLRRNVKWHDGSQFTAADVVFTIERIPTIKDSPASLSIYTRQIEEIKIIDPYTLRFRTNGPAPLLPVYLSNILIISKNAALGASTEDFNSGKAAVGTGPYKFVRWSKGEKVELVRNEDYWGNVEPWERVEIREISEISAREAALLAGDVDVIEKPSVHGLENLGKQAEVVSSVTLRIIYLMLDVGQEPSPGISGTAGKNPLKDIRVRKAIDMGIDRNAIVENIMDGMTEPTSQYAVKGHYGYNPEIPVTRFDPETAKKLLAEAGWGDGFGIVISTPNNRNINEVKVAQFMASTLAQIGLQPTVDAMPLNMWVPRRAKFEFSAFTLGAGPNLDLSVPLTILSGTRDPEKGSGASNYSGYSNSEFDALLAEALRTVDNAEREELYKTVSKMAMNDFVCLPLYFEPGIWVLQKGLTMTPRTDAKTFAMGIRPK